MMDQNELGGLMTLTEETKGQGRNLRGHHVDLTVGILVLSAIQGRTYDEQVEILGETILKLAHELRAVYKTIDEISNE